MICVVRNETSSKSEKWLSLVYSSHQKNTLSLNKYFQKLNQKELWILIVQVNQNYKK